MKPTDHEAMPDLRLSPAGHDRREAMLPQLHAEMARIHTARRVRRRLVASTGLIAALAFAVVIAMPGRDHPTPAPVETVATIPSPPAMTPKAAVETTRSFAALKVSTEQVIDRVHIERINDSELLRTLSAVGHPVGIIQVAGQAARLTQDLPGREETEPDDRSSALPNALG